MNLAYLPVVAGGLAVPGVAGAGRAAAGLGEVDPEAPAPELGVVLVEVGVGFLS